MRKTNGFRLLALVLALTMAVPGTAYAAKPGRGNNRQNWWNSFTPSKTTTTTTTETEMEVVESAETVENPEMLRATTYELTTTETTTTTTSTWGITRESTEAISETKNVLKYFNATLYDYDKDTINAATHAADGNDAVYEGIYFINGDGDSPYTKETKTDLSAFVAGEYYIQNIRASQNVVKSWLKSVTYNGIVGESIQGTTKGDATVWTLVIEDGEYYLMSEGKYLVIGNGGEGEKLSDTKTAIEISAFSGDSRGVQLSQNDNYLCQWWDQYGLYIYYGGYGENNDAGNGMLFYPVGSNEPITPGESSEEKIISGYEEWNRWDKASGSNTNGDLIYTGLVESTLDANKDVVFTKPEGGIFNNDATVKKIYPGVEMPFLYENGYYTFDASQNGVYIKEDAEQKSTATAETTKDSTGTLVTPRLYFDTDAPQSNGGTYGDGSSTVWMPFNGTTSINGEANCNYHFGMRTTIPFAMTANGRVDEMDDKSEAITFSFSGDDDVWVFIDGHLVIDLGGIHNRLDATINFQANTVTYSEANAGDPNGETGSYNNSSFATTQTLFENLIPQDRTAFASVAGHELTIFYLERGAGSSNCKIKFNLPVKDTVTVTKDATKSWDEKTDTVTLLTDEEQATVNAIPFGFTLYRKSTATDTEFEAVANEKYYLINKNGQIAETRETDATGHFTLLNGQSARFISTAMDDEDGVTYYVVEDSHEAFTQPDYNYAGEAAGNSNGQVFYNSVTAENYASGDLIPEFVLSDDDPVGKSGEITVYGSEEADDSLVFICSNFLDAELPNPSIRPTNEQIVIDYGLPVEIDVLKNDLHRSNTVQILKVTGEGMTGKVNTIGTAEVASTEETIVAGTVPFNTFDNLTADAFSGSALKYGTVQIIDEKNDEGEIIGGKLVYTLNKPMTGVEVLNYLVKVSGTAAISDIEGSSEVTVYEYAIATVHIIPATSMYYEEDFTGLVTYTDGAASWQPAVIEGEYQSDFQEPGVVGTVGDSPYGSDAAYLNDSKDSNGTSRYADTTSGSVKFSYEFTGTGTSFFGRTSANSGYMRVIVKDVDGVVQQDLRRSTIYKAVDGTDVGTLYNVPIYTFEADNYGTYTVEVEVMKALPAVNRGKDFYLDGIRVMNPLNVSDENKTVAESAYATDAEANNAVATLRQKLLGDSQINEDGSLSYNGTNFVVFTDTNGAVTSAEEYRSNGPKEEVYLNNGQSISFAVKGEQGWDTEGNHIYLGAKAPLGSGSITVNGRTLTLSNAADCYFDISNLAQVTTDANGVKTAAFTIQSTSSLVSLTNIKVTGKTEFTIVENINGDNDNSGDEIIGDDENVEDDENGEDIIVD